MPKAKSKMPKKTAGAVDQMEREFISVISHQLKTPLAELKGFIDNMFEGLTGELNPKQAEYLRLMSGIVERNIEQIEDFLTLSRLAKGRVKISNSRFNLSEIVRNAITPFRVLMADKGVDLKAEYDKNITVYGDPEKIGTCIQKILSRSVRVSLPKDSITLSVMRDQNEARVVISDQGPEIPATEKKLLFQSPYHLLLSRETSNVDFRFYIVNELLKFQGGRLLLESQPEGTSVTIMLPLENKK